MLTPFQSYLSSIGVNVKEVNETSISFESNNLQYLFLTDSSDPYYFRLILPNIAIVTDENTSKINQVVNSSNTKFKVAKSFIIDDKVWVSVEQFVYSRENINELFNRSLNLLETFMSDFRKEIKA